MSNALLLDGYGDGLALVWELGIPCTLMRVAESIIFFLEPLAGSVNFLRLSI